MKVLYTTPDGLVVLAMIAAFSVLLWLCVVVFRLAVHRKPPRRQKRPAGAGRRSEPWAPPPRRR